MPEWPLEGALESRAEKQKAPWRVPFKEILEPSSPEYLPGSAGVRVEKFCF